MAVRPKVTIVTPVYNGEAFLTDAIESVRAQTYSDWKHIIVDNSSTDGTFEIARRCAARDERIKVVRLTPHLPVIQHWNRAFELLPADTVYCKELHADDVLRPNCIAEMVDFMERHPSVSLVSSYIMYDDAVSNTGVPLKTPVVPGAEVIRRTLTGEWYLFGCPSSVMIRMDALRALGGQPYDETVRHADIDLWYRLLDGRDFGFIHQVLSCERTHDSSQTNGLTARYSTLVLEHLCFLRHYGPRYLSPEAYRRAHLVQLREYRRRIARRLVGGGGLAYWRYHSKTMARYGYRLGAADVVLGVLSELALWIIDMRHAARSCRKLLGKISRGVRRIPSGLKQDAPARGEKEGIVATRAVRRLRWLRPRAADQIGSSSVSQ